MSSAATNPPAAPLSDAMLDLDTELTCLLDLHRRNPRADAVRVKLTVLRRAVGRQVLIDRLLDRHPFDAEPLETLAALLRAALQAGVGWHDIAATVNRLGEAGR